MDTRWSKWKDVPSERRPRGKYPRPFEDSYGIYQIRAVDGMGKPIPIPRMAEVDRGGVLYIGRSGYKGTKRTLAVRVQEFVHGPHSGGETYYLIKTCVKSLRRGIYKGHKLQYQVVCLSGNKKEIDQQEIKTLAQYCSKFGELPPCNSSFPGKFGSFASVLLQQLQSTEQ